MQQDQEHRKKTQWSILKQWNRIRNTRRMEQDKKNKVTQMETLEQYQENRNRTQKHWTNLEHRCLAICWEGRLLTSQDLLLTMNALTIHEKKSLYRSVTHTASNKLALRIVPLLEIFRNKIFETGILTQSAWVLTLWLFERLCKKIPVWVRRYRSSYSSLNVIFYS